MSSSELSESQAVITPRSPTRSRQLTTPVTPEWCVYVCVCLKKKKGRLIEREKENERQEVYVHAASMHPVLP